MWPCLCRAAFPACGNQGDRDQDKQQSSVHSLGTHHSLALWRLGIDKLHPDAELSDVAYMFVRCVQGNYLLAFLSFCYPGFCNEMPVFGSPASP